MQNPCNAIVSYITSSLVSVWHWRHGVSSSFISMLCRCACQRIGNRYLCLTQTGVTILSLFLYLSGVQKWNGATLVDRPCLWYTWFFSMLQLSKPARQAHLRIFLTVKSWWRFWCDTSPYWQKCPALVQFPSTFCPRSGLVRTPAVAVGCALHVQQPLALAVVNLPAFRLRFLFARTRLNLFCLVFGTKFNILSALFVRQSFTLPQKNDSREGLFWCKKGWHVDVGKMNFYLKKPPLAPCFGPFLAEYGAICCKMACNMRQNAVRFGAKWRAFWC